jgi:uncharacterized LabA/DUF88 family protein
VILTRVNYYDCAPAEGEQDPQDMRGYCRAVELLVDADLSFGLMRGKPRRQKRVDTQIAVDMVVGAFTGIFSVAVLIAADEDHVPTVQELRRRGVMIALGAFGAAPGLSPELVRAADRFLDLSEENAGIAVLTHNGKTWP